MAFWLAARRSRRARPALWLARILYGAWVLLVFVAGGLYALLSS